MARRDVTDYRTVTNVLAEDPNKAIGMAADIGQDIIRRSQEAKIVEGMSAASLELNALTDQFQKQYEGDPFSQQGLTDLKEKRRGVLDKYAGEISPIFRGAWNEAAGRLQNQNDAQVDAWGYKQATVNTKVSLQNSFTNNFNDANRMGRQGISEGEALAVYAQSRKELEEYAMKNLGEVTAGELLKDYEKDYLKSYMAGIAESDPVRAGKILSNPELTEKFSTDERSEFASAINKSVALKKFETTMQQTEGSGVVFDVLNDPETDYYGKRLAIDKMELQGQISTSTATKARRVLKSENDLDAITNTPVMSDIITRIYDLNALQETNSEGYLEGVQNIREEIMTKQADGELTAPDAAKLNNQLKTLTSAKMSDATQRVGMEFYEAKQKFDMLPPEFRGRATRELFYRTQGKDGVSKQTYNVYADDIVTTINHERRTSALKRVNTINMPDMDFLKQNNITSQQVSEAAKNKNISEAEVVRLLKAKMVSDGKPSKPVILKSPDADYETLNDIFNGGNTEGE